MAEFEIKAGAKLDVLTKPELDDAITTGYRSWIQELGRGKKPRRFAQQGTVAADNTLTLRVTGPNESCIWAVTRLAVSGMQTGDYVTLHVNDDSPSTLVQPFIDVTDPVAYFDTHQLILNGGEDLILSGQDLTAESIITVSGAAIEVPRTSFWML